MSILRRITASIQAWRYPKEPDSTSAAVFSKEKEEREQSLKYEKAVKAIREKYHFIDELGALAVRAIVDFRASAIAGGEISLSGEKKTTDILKDWFQRANVYKKTVEFAKLAEREGRLAVCLYVMETGDIGLKALPYSQYKYRLKYDKYGKVEGIGYDTKDGEYEIFSPYLVYLTYSNNDEMTGEQQIPPKVAYCLNDIEEIDRQMKHWSKVNEYFADPTPHLDTEEQNFFEPLRNIVSGKPPNGGPKDEGSRKWKLGQGLVTWKTTLKYVQADLSGVESLDRNIQVRAQRISVMSGYPIYLWYPELMSNRATAVEIASDTNSATVMERIGHQELWTQICINVCAISNQFFGSALNPIGLYATLPQISAAQIKLLIDTFQPLVNAKQISVRTFLEMLPNIDSEEEIKRLSDERSGEIAGISNALLNTQTNEEEVIQ
ncbi:hypothetical protein [Leptospira bandrabouensis]|uniref:hypothetical protein n=1 Tax=Leptospira bandrabouensis TaxID=2484903 RepID=UPI0010915610|nr:hypothetical protein [Leptospira bandrabouensis]TGN08579.1 hypothetical protein EHR07_03420 [Leptospira bandrabouensis]